MTQGPGTTGWSTIKCLSGFDGMSVMKVCLLQVNLEPDLNFVKRKPHAGGSQQWLVADQAAMVQGKCHVSTYLRIIVVIIARSHWVFDFSDMMSDGSIALPPASPSINNCILVCMELMQCARDALEIIVIKAWQLNEITELHECMDSGVNKWEGSASIQSQKNSSATSFRQNFCASWKKPRGQGDWHCLYIAIVTGDVFPLTVAGIMASGVSAM
ncbi:hypothetical protein BDR06DRAFT_973889 [Suillus hirtellus]|nr:hypothetical protein BDR06DRAFT_973889 [Suillus hirtellus]